MALQIVLAGLNLAESGESKACACEFSRVGNAKESRLAQRSFWLHSRKILAIQRPSCQMVQGRHYMVWKDGL
jgi:hypothetical protein